MTFIERHHRERIVLVGVAMPPTTVDQAEASLDELSLLVDTAGADEVERVLQRRDAPDPATYVGRGKAQELRTVSETVDSDTVVFDDELTPAQSRNLEKILGRTAIDRTAVILDIFATRARRRSSWRSCATGCRVCAAAAPRSASRRVASARVVRVRHSSRSTAGGCCGV